MITVTLFCITITDRFSINCVNVTTLGSSEEKIVDAYVFGYKASLT